jgi:hypothetical protein
LSSFCVHHYLFLLAFISHKPLTQLETNLGRNVTWVVLILKFQKSFPKEHVWWNYYLVGMFLIWSSIGSQRWLPMQYKVLTWDPIGSKYFKSFFSKTTELSVLIRNPRSSSLIEHHGNWNKLGLRLWCLTPLSSIYLLYRGSQFYWWRKQRKPPISYKSLANFYHIMLYLAHLAMKSQLEWWYW